MKLKINRCDCKKLAGRVFAEPITVWVNCTPNASSLEIITLLENSDFDLFDSEEEDDLSSLPQWEQEMYREEKALMEKLDSWEHSYRIEKAPSYKSFNWMVKFVEEIIAPKDPKAAAIMGRQVGGKGTFYRFKVAASRCGYLDDWHKYVNECETIYVAHQLHYADIEVVESGGLPVAYYPEP